MGDLLLVDMADWHLIKELPSGFHVRVRIVGGEENAVDSDHVHHGLIDVVGHTPTAIHLASRLVD